MARDFIQRLQADRMLSASFQPCLAALARHIGDAGERIARLAA